MALAADTPADDSAAVKRTERRASGVAFGAHALHDGYTDLIYVMLPIWQAEFGLGYAALGMLRGLFSGSMAGLQIPAGMIAERFGPATVLAAGTALSGAGFCVAGASTGLAMLIVALALGGVGSSTQHPLGSELIARTYAGSRSLKALGAYNFSGDVGKMTVPALAALMITVMPWRASLMLLGSIGILAAAAILLLMPRAPVVPQPTAAAETRAAENDAPPLSNFPFWNLVSIGVFDSATRMAFLTFLPFVLTAKGASLPTIGLALTLVFAGGAAGKLVCAFVGARIGVIGTVWLTETLTAAGIVALLPLSLEPALVLLPLIGVALNGTSSVLYGSVPFLVAPERRSRAFGIFYTGTIGSGAIAPVIFGFAGDLFGVPVALIMVAAIALATLPLALLLKPALAQHA
jgi:MFS family permease